MLRFVDQSSRGLTRREWLRIGGLAGLGWMLPLQQSSASPVTRPAGFGRAKSVLLIYASGGQSQLDMWDLKPQAPDTVRGEFRPIRTCVPGIAICEHLPRIARVMDRLTLVRSMSHEDLDHGSATYLTLTGQYHQQRSANPPPSANDLPTYGAVLQRLGTFRRFVHEAVHLNGPALVPTNPAPGQNAGLLGGEYDPLLLGDVTQRQVAVPGLEPRPELPTVRMEQRLTLKENLDRFRQELAHRPELLEVHHLYRQAFEMLSSDRCLRAFDLGEESEATHERYGRHRSGQACLLARRLVEAGVPLTTVIWSHSNRGQDQDPTATDLYGWDTHNDIFESLKVHLLPRFDQTFAALLEDLDERGLLDETLVICMGEFGRAPQVAFEARFAGRSPGRKHWASVYSIVVAGAGVSRGAVLGASDRLGAEPVTKRYGPWDVAATLYSTLGIDPAGHYLDPLGRPFPLATGHVMEELFR